MGRNKTQINSVEKKTKKKYTIIAATPTYFIINKDGNYVFITKINNYKKGDTVSI